MGAEVIMIIETDLECGKCFDKIHNLLSKGKEKAGCCCCTVFCRVTSSKKKGKHVKKISTITCDRKKSTVTISGTFDPVKLEWFLRREAGDAIKNITIVKPAAEKEKEEKKKKEEEEKKKKEESTLNIVQLTQICNMCYPWPCRDPSHLQVGVLPHQYPQQPQLQWAPAPVTPPHGWPPVMPSPVQMMQPPPMCGPSSCRGCKGCRIVQEGKFSYEEYPQNANCAIM